jgi:hypothetical protein
VDLVDNYGFSAKAKEVRGNVIEPGCLYSDVIGGNIEVSLVSIILLSQVLKEQSCLSGPSAPDDSQQSAIPIDGFLKKTTT